MESQAILRNYSKLSEKLSHGNVEKEWRRVGLKVFLIIFDIFIKSLIKVSS